MDILVKMDTRNKLLKKLIENKKEESKIEKEIRDIDAFIQNKCIHVWQYYRESSWDSSDHKCEKCFTFKSEVKINN